MIKKNLRHLHAIVTKQTYWRLMHWAEAVGLPEKEIGRIIDRWSGKRRSGRAPAAGLRRNARTPGGSGPRRSRRKAVNTSCRSNMGSMPQPSFMRRIQTNGGITIRNVEFIRS